MLQVGEGHLTTLGRVRPGRLVLVYGASNPGQIALTVARDNELADDETDERSGLFLLGPTFHPYPDDDRRSLYDLGPPTVRFDPTSIIGPNESPPSGALIDTGNRIGVYEQSGPGRGMLADFSGAYSGFYREYGQPAFTRWEIGLMRGQEFVQIHKIDLKGAT